MSHDTGQALMQPHPIVCVLETLEPNPLDSSHEIGVEMISVDGACRMRGREGGRGAGGSEDAWVAGLRG